MTEWRVGMRCRCVKRGEWDNECPPILNPIRGQELTVRAVVPFFDGTIGLLFDEIVNSFHEDFEREPDFWAGRFEPIVDTRDRTTSQVEKLKDLAAKAPPLRSPANV